MKQHAALFIIVMTVSLLFFACGDPSSPVTDRQINKLQNQENTNLRISELKPIVGKYTGSPDTRNGLYRSREDRWIQAELNLTIHAVSQQDPKNVDNIVVPHLSGSLKWWVEGTEIYLEFNIESGEYNPQTNRVYLLLEDDSSIEGSIRDTIFEAAWHSSSRGNNAGRFVLVKH